MDELFKPPVSLLFSGSIHDAIRQVGPCTPCLSLFVFVLYCVVPCLVVSCRVVSCLVLSCLGLVHVFSCLVIVVCSLLLSVLLSCVVSPLCLSDVPHSCGVCVCVCVREGMLVNDMDVHLLLAGSA